MASIQRHYRQDCIFGDLNLKVVSDLKIRTKCYYTMFAPNYPHPNIPALLHKKPNTDDPSKHTYKR
jgi:hypothetical protein